MKNKYNLDRTIPNPIKRQIRQRDGFGCVICGLGIIEYEHVNPEFSEAKVHDPSCMTILCPSCHHKVTTGMWSKDKVLQAMQNPKCLTQGYSKEIFDIGSGYPSISIGNNKFRRVKIPLEIRSTPLLIIDEPENPGEPFRISADFFDSTGNGTLKIVENEWQASSDNWDVEVVSSSIIIKEKMGKIHLQLDANPPEEINISRIDMKLNGLQIKIDNQNLLIIDPTTGRRSNMNGNVIANSIFGIIV